MPRARRIAATRLLACACAAVLAYGLAALGAQAAGVPVVLISIDGLKPDYVTQADRHRLQIPTLRRFLREGLHATAVTGVLPTVTYPSHTTMVTGVSPARHGILYNTPFDPFNRNQGGWMWYAEDIKVETLWGAVSAAGHVVSSVDWPVTVGAPISHNIVQFWRASTEDDHKLLRALSTPGLLDAAERDLGRYPAGYVYTVPADTTRAAFSAWVIARKKPRFHTAYFSVLDEVQHAKGPDTRELFEALEAVDGMIATVERAAREADRRTIVCVVSDHGFAGYDRTVAVNVALREAGLIDVEPDGAVRQWKAMTWANAVMLEEPADAGTRAKVAGVLAGLAADPSTGIFRVMDAEDIAREGGFPGAAFVVGVRPGFAISGRVDGPLVRVNDPAGTHGLLRELPEMDSAFFLVGEGIPRGRILDRIDMRDIAPTLARLAGVSLPAAEGRDLLAR